MILIFSNLYSALVNGASKLKSPFLLLVRLYWGWSFMMTGKGKLEHIDKITAFFHDLGIPLPMLNAYLAGSTEFLGGLLLLLGLGGRLASLPLIFTMTIAYVTAESEALHSIFSDPDKFTGADPFLFLYAAVIVLLFGPGCFSLDALLKKKFSRNPSFQGKKDPA
jgi:putative oxidoreductase